MLRWISQNYRTFLWAFALAMAVWISAVTSADPDESRALTSPVPLQVIGQSPNLVLSNDIPKEVEVTLRAPEERRIGYASDFYQIIGDQAMPAFDELKRGLGLTDAALAQNENALPKNLNKHTMHRNMRGKLDIQVFDKRAVDGRRRMIALQNGNLVFIGAAQHDLARLMPPR